MNNILDTSLLFIFSQVIKYRLEFFIMALLFECSVGAEIKNGKEKRRRGKVQIWSPEFWTLKKSMLVPTVHALEGALT